MTHQRGDVDVYSDGTMRLAPEARPLASRLCCPRCGLVLKREREPGIYLCPCGALFRLYDERRAKLSWRADTKRSP